MLVKQRRASTNPYLRSLLQKVVRRGHSELAAAVTLKLDQIGDGRWLRSRAVVLAYEECWPAAIDIALSPGAASKVSWLGRLAGLRKNKEAAGLGSLAYALSEGDTTVLDGSPDERAIRFVASAIQRPKDFWGWIKSQASSPVVDGFVRRAKIHSSAPTWPWDKAFVLAATCLALTEAKVPEVASGTSHEKEFPFWCAVDKHTPAGKAALATVSKKLKVPARQLIWASFYFESAVVNDLDMGAWWDAERRWRLRRAGITVDQGRALWERAREPFIVETAEATDRLLRDLAEAVPVLG